LAYESKRWKRFEGLEARAASARSGHFVLVGLIVLTLDGPLPDQPNARVLRRPLVS